MSSELASAEACMLASAGVFRLARMGCWSTDALLLASRFAWYTDGASSEPPVASNWAPIGAEGPWRPSDEATLTASNFSAGSKTVPLCLPAPPTPPGAHASAGGPVATVSSCFLVPDTVPEHTGPVAPHTGPTVTPKRTMSSPSSPKSSTTMYDAGQTGYQVFESRCFRPVVRLPVVAAPVAASHPNTRAEKPRRTHYTRSHFTGLRFFPCLVPFSFRSVCVSVDLRKRVRDPS
ncbi:hypothetical protein WH47_00943 [Habropoda laboriosa]|uniref:Uncharacterized protein n=1 Tax=Habropoda laboriosa TaxID=597456 RepID=A0A0L7R6Y6_9HYME|nr:hypothetical protein WH47_00943 [Habropoda laboriosa]